MIYETIITTINPDQTVHIAPMGIQKKDDMVFISPFKPSRTLDNLDNLKQAVINVTDDVRVFAGCLTGHYDWPTQATEIIQGQRLTNTLHHFEVKVEKKEEDELRPRFICRIVNTGTHGIFNGFNRAQGAIIEAAILVSRLDRLPMEKITRELEYLKIAIDKTAGPRELEAWGWLNDRIQSYRQQSMASEDVI